VEIPAEKTQQEMTNK